MAEINGINVPFIPVEKAENLNRNEVVKDNTFSELFRSELNKIKFSGHAIKRLESRNIKLTDTEIDKIQTAVEKAEEKGVKDSLVMIDNKAFIVNIPNKTVITALSITENEDNIFTNIDSVIFAQ